MILEEHEHKFYTQDPDGCYTVNFPNRHALTKQEIEQRFAPFGQVLSVHCAGDERGFRFVRLTTMDEVVAAIVGLRNDPAIQLKERRVNNKNRNGNHENRNGKYENRNGNYNKTPNGKNGWTQKKNGSQTSEDGKSDRGDDDKMSVSSRISARLVRIRSPSVKDVEAELVNGDDKTEEQSEMPPLVIAKTPLVVTAQEVIVANIHDNYGCAFILHLFEKCNPIAITEMKYIQHLRLLKYCHVYFRTEVEADIAIQGYDNYNLLGKKLIVFKPV